MDNEAILFEILVASNKLTETIIRYNEDRVGTGDKNYLRYNVANICFSLMNKVGWQITFKEDSFYIKLREENNCNED